MTNPDLFVVAVSRAPMAMAAGFMMLSLLVSAQVSFNERPDAALREIITQALRELKRWLGTLRGDAVLTRQLIERATLPHLDLTRMARYVLGSYWQSATPSQCDRFRSALRAHLLRICSQTMEKHVAEIEQLTCNAYIRCRLLHYDAGRGTATIQVIAIGRRLGWMQLQLQLHNYDGTWKIYEITSSGVNLLVGIRSDIQAQLRSDGLETVIRRLEHRAGHRPPD